MQAQPLCFPPEKLGDQGLDHVGLDLFGEALTNNRRRNMAAAKPGNTGDFLIFLDQRVGLAVDVRDRNLNLNLALGAAFFCFSGAHNYLSKTAHGREGGAPLSRFMT